MGARHKKRAVIIGGGEILDYGAVAARIIPGDYVICADGGYRHCQRLGVRPELLVGDFDSLKISQVAPDIPRLTFPPDKDYTDGTLAAETALERGFDELLLTGMLGGRLDHTLANLQTLAWLSGRGVWALLTDGRTDAFAITDGQLSFGPYKAHYFSLLCYSRECAGVTIAGAKYPLDDYTLRFDSPRAISNEFLSGPATVTVGSGTLIVVVTPMDREDI